MVLPSSRIKCIKETSWNTFKPGAWEAYKEVTKRNASNIEKIVNNMELNEEEIMKKVDKQGQGNQCRTPGVKFEE